MALVYTKPTYMVKGEAFLIHAKWMLLLTLFMWCMCIWICHLLTLHPLIFPTTRMQSINMLLSRWSFFTLCVRIASCDTKDGYTTSIEPQTGFLEIRWVNP